MFSQPHPLLITSSANSRPSVIYIIGQLSGIGGVNHHVPHQPPSTRWKLETPWHRNHLHHPGSIFVLILGLKSNPPHNNTGGPKVNGQAATAAPPGFPLSCVTWQLSWSADCACQRRQSHYFLVLFILLWNNQGRTQLKFNKGNKKNILKLPEILFI